MSKFLPVLKVRIMCKIQGFLQILSILNVWVMVAKHKIMRKVGPVLKDKIMCKILCLFLIKDFKNMDYAQNLVVSEGQDYDIIIGDSVQSWWVPELPAALPECPIGYMWAAVPCYGGDCVFCNRVMSKQLVVRAKWTCVMCQGVCLCWSLGILCRHCLIR